jgi:hypothetical protein
LLVSSFLCPNHNCPILLKMRNTILCKHISAKISHWNSGGYHSSIKLVSVIRSPLKEHLAQGGHEYRGHPFWYSQRGSSKHLNHVSFSQQCCRLKSYRLSAWSLPPPGGQWRKIICIWNKLILFMNSPLQLVGRVWFWSVWHEYLNQGGARICNCKRRAQLLGNKMSTDPSGQTSS